MKEKILYWAFKLYGEKAQSSAHTTTALLFVVAAALVWLGFAEADTAELQRVRFGVWIVAVAIIALFGASAFVSGLFVATSRFDLAKIKREWEIEQSEKILNQFK